MTPTRRSLLLSAALSAVSASAARAAAHSILLGGPVFLESKDPNELAREHRRLGYSAAYCPDAKLSDGAHVRAIETAFAREKVVIAEVGAWKNMLDPDGEKRKGNLAYVVERCALAEAVGARCCVDIAGSYNASVWYGPDSKNLSKDFFDATVENCRHILDSVNPKRTRFTIEMMGWNLPDGPDSYMRLIKAVDRPSFGVHLDVCNGVNSPSRFYDNKAFIEDCFQKLGPWIISCHAKDLQWIPEMNVHFVEVVPGRGQIDYRTYLTQLSRLAQPAPLMLEHLKTAVEYDEGRKFIKSVGEQIGVSFA